jgi:hypothetical protein
MECIVMKKIINKILRQYQIMREPFDRYFLGRKINCLSKAIYKSMKNSRPSISKERSHEIAMNIIWGMIK